MPKLTFPVSPTGLTVDALVGLERAAMAALHAAGQPLPAPVRCRGLIDTGTDITGVSRLVLQRLGLTRLFRHTTQTIAGTLQVDLYEVSLGITDFTTVGAPQLTYPRLRVMELVTALTDIDVLIGMDVILGCRMLVDGPARQFTLDF